jgi:pimeloyl-ACP methyl ester carboxylesterase
MTTLAVASREVTLSHGKTRYLEAGSGAPVVLIHGVAVAGGADDWRPALQHLGSSYRFVAPDVIGFPPGDTRANLDAFPYMTDFIREFQDALDIRSSHVIGATMGGWIAGLFAYESPNRVDKLIMTGNPGFHGARNDRLSTFQVPNDEAVRAAIDKVAPMLSESERAAIVQAKVDRLHDPDYAAAHGAMMATMGNPENRTRFNLLRRLPYVTAPTLFLLGRRDPTSDVAGKLQGLVPASQYHIIEEGGHQIHYENAPEFSRTVLDFLG